LDLAHVTDFFFKTLLCHYYKVPIFE
jgi:hypothetical protein